jgi:hypothetical protein
MPETIPLLYVAYNQNYKIDLIRFSCQIIKQGCVII